MIKNPKVGMRVKVTDPRHCAGESVGPSYPHTGVILKIENERTIKVSVDGENDFLVEMSPMSHGDQVQKKSQTGAQMKAYHYYATCKTKHGNVQVDGIINISLQSGITSMDTYRWVKGQICQDSDVLQPKNLTIHSLTPLD